jgi:hypothetical protein
MRVRVLVLVACGGCLVTDVPDGNWTRLDAPCAVASPAAQQLGADSLLTDFQPAGASVLFDTTGGLAQLGLGARHPQTISSSFPSGTTYSEFYVVANDLVYFDAPADKRFDMVIDHGANASNRWERIASISDTDFTSILATPGGLYWREAGWQRWTPATGLVHASELPDVPTLLTDGATLFYKDGDDLYTAAIGSAPIRLATVDQFTLPIGIADGTAYVWHQDTFELTAITPAGTRTIATTDSVGPPANHAFGGGYFYYSPPSRPSAIFRVALDTGTQETLPAVDGRFLRIKADACNVYWTAFAASEQTELWARAH